MKKKAKVFDFFPAVYDDETDEVHIIEKAWQNGILLTVFHWALNIINSFYEPMTGESLNWVITVKKEEYD